MEEETPSTPILDLPKSLDRYRRDLEGCSHAHGGESFFLLMRDLASYLADIGEDSATEFIRLNKCFKAYRSFFMPLQNAYYQAVELEEAISLEKKLWSASQSVLDIFDREFSRNAYLRLKDLHDYVDFSRCSTFVMVGCGPLPATLFYIHEKTNVQTVLGMDSSQEAVDIAGRLLARHKFPRMQLVCIDGMDFDYQGADVVYIANLVSPKKKILHQIIETGKKDVIVVLRDPYAMGVLLSESGMEDLDPRFCCMGEGIQNEYFLSKHFFLRRV